MPALFSVPVTSVYTTLAAKTGMFLITFTLHGRNKLFLNRDEYHLLTTFIAVFCHMWCSALSAKFGTLCIHGRNVFTFKCRLCFILVNICCSFCASATGPGRSWILNTEVRPQAGPGDQAS